MTCWEDKQSIAWKDEDNSCIWEDFVLKQPNVFMNFERSQVVFNTYWSKIRGWGDKPSPLIVKAM